MANDYQANASQHLPDVPPDDSQPLFTKRFIINNTEYETNSLTESILDSSTGELFPTLQPFLKHIAPDLIETYKFNPNFPADFYRIGDASRVRVIRRLQYLHDPPPITPLIHELAPLIQWMAENTSNSQMVSRSFWRAMYATENDALAAASLILYYGIFASHNAHGKAVPNFNYHAIYEEPDSIIIETHQSHLLPRFRNVQRIALNEQDRVKRTGQHKPTELIKKLAFREFYSASPNGGLWITQTPEIHQYLQKLILDILANPKAKLPDYEPPNFDEPFTVVVPKKPLETRQYYRPSGYELIPLDPDKIYTTKELLELGFSSPNITKACKKSYLIKVDRGKYQLNRNWEH